MPISRQERMDGGGDSSSQVANHYNTLEEKGLDVRAQSRIYYLRNFNNWIKSMIIGDSLTDVRNGKSRNDGKITVLDLCCGKGGDLLKWKKGEIDHLVCADIADVSLDQCQQRYGDMKNRTAHERRPTKSFTADFIHADCSKVRLRDRYSNPDIQFDLCSCQFSLHYSFVSLEQAHCMLRNACENLKMGGYFIGTIPNASQIVRFVENNDGVTFKNEVVSVRLDKAARSYPLFGAKFDFHLLDVVNCPEYLVHFPLLVEMLRKYGMELVYKKTFADIYQERGLRRGKDLLARMQGLEPYPPDEDVSLMGNEVDNEYQCAQGFYGGVMDRERDRGDRSRRPNKMGTLSKSEWEAAAMYLAFAFRKVDQSKAR